MKESNIEWTNHTWNPWQGCRPVSPGCDNCYMYREKEKFKQDPSKVIRSSEKTFNQPLKWADPAKVFVCSWSDFFIEDADEWRDDAWEIMRKTPHITYLLLTKRPENIEERLPADWPLENVWLGVTAENQEMADKRIPFLLRLPAAVRFISVGPMIDEVDLRHYIGLDGINGDSDFAEENGWGYSDWSGGFLGTSDPTYDPQPGIHWIICEGESGPDARPIHPEWVRSLRDQCLNYEIPFFFKQWGEWAPLGDKYGLSKDHAFHKKLSFSGSIGMEAVFKIGKKRSGNWLDDQKWEQFPEGVKEHA